MKLTQIIPTDKNGNVYYGCTTYAEAKAAIDFEWSLPDGDHPSDTARRIASNMEEAGYIRIAARLRKEYGINI